MFVWKVFRENYISLVYLKITVVSSPTCVFLETLHILQKLDAKLSGWSSVYTYSLGFNQFEVRKQEIWHWQEWTKSKCIWNLEVHKSNGSAHTHLIEFESFFSHPLSLTRNLDFQFYPSFNAGCECVNSKNWGKKTVHYIECKLMGCQSWKKNSSLSRMWTS
jgi:hypothetical protein